MKFKIRNLSKSSKLGRVWVEDHSPMLVNLREKFSADRPFEGLRIGVCLPGTWESFMFLSVLRAGSAKLLYYPMFCQPEVGIELMRNNTAKLFDYGKVARCVKDSDFIYDSTALFGKLIIEQNIPTKGIVEQTASGITIYKDFDSKGLLRQPVLDLDGSYVKRVGENKLATGMGLVEALLKLHFFLPNKQVLILGGGSVGSGCAMFLKGVGCKVALFDVDSEKMMKAKKEGYQIGTLKELLQNAEIIVNATGSSTPVLESEELKGLKSGAILANMGGSGWDQSFFLDKKVQIVGDWVKKIFLTDATYIYELAQGFPVNFIFASGTDTETMDVVFSLSVLALEYLIKNYDSLPKTLQPIPEEIQLKHIDLVKKLSKRKDLTNLKEEQQ